MLHQLSWQKTVATDSYHGGCKQKCVQITLQLQLYSPLFLMLQVYGMAFQWLLHLCLRLLVLRTIYVDLCLCMQKHSCQHCIIIIHHCITKLYPLLVIEYAIKVTAHIILSQLVAIQHVHSPMSCTQYITTFTDVVYRRLP